MPHNSDVSVTAVPVREVASWTACEILLHMLVHIEGSNQRYLHVARVLRHTTLPSQLRSSNSNHPRPQTPNPTLLLGSAPSP